MNDKNKSKLDNQRPLRSVKSYVKRAGRLTKGQKRALDVFSGDYLIEFLDKKLDISQLFDKESPLVIEIGFGMGDSLVEMAKENPNTNYLGIEVHEPGVGNILNRINESGLTNLKVIMHDAVDVLNMMITDQSIDGFQIFFPDPWHKKRHHKRRLIQEKFVDVLVKKLKKEGFIHLATDWEDYSEHMLEVLNNSTELKNRFDAFAPRPDSRPLTKFEKRGELLSHGVWDLIFDKK